MHCHNAWLFLTAPDIRAISLRYPSLIHLCFIFASSDFLTQQKAHKNKFLTSLDLIESAICNRYGRSWSVSLRSTAFHASSSSLTITPTDIFIWKVYRPTIPSEQARYSRIEIFIDFIKRRPTSDLELTFKDDAGVKHQSNKFKKGVPICWGLDMSVHLPVYTIILRYWLITDSYVRTHTSAKLTVQRALLNISVAEISVEFEPNQFGDDSAVLLKGCRLSFPV